MSGEPLPGNGDLLAHRYRRYLLYCLQMYTTPMRLPDIADQITVWEASTEDDGEFLRERLRIYDALYHDHLPVLREADVVVYRQADDTVDLGPTAAGVTSAVERELRRECADLLHAEGSTFDADEGST